MTNTERKIRKQMHQEFVIKKLVAKTKEELDQYIWSRVEDRHFADSWDQSMQISLEIEQLELRKQFLDTCLIKINCGKRLCANELTQFRKTVLHPCW